MLKVIQTGLSMFQLWRIHLCALFLFGFAQVEAQWPEALFGLKNISSSSLNNHCSPPTANFQASSKAHSKLKFQFKPKRRFIKKKKCVVKIVKGVLKVIKILYIFRKYKGILEMLYECYGYISTPEPQIKKIKALSFL